MLIIKNETLFRGSRLILCYGLGMVLVITAIRVIAAVAAATVSIPIAAVATRLGTITGDVGLPRVSARS